MSKSAARDQESDRGRIRPSREPMLQIPIKRKRRVIEITGTSSSPMEGFIESIETVRRAPGLPTASMTDRRARLLEIWRLAAQAVAARPALRTFLNESCDTVAPQDAPAPAAQGATGAATFLDRSEARDSSRCDQSQSHEMRAWRAARRLAMTIYRLTAATDFQEDAELRRQMRRSSAALMSDVAELYEAPSRADSHRSVRNARSSVIRLQSHLAIAADRYYIEPQTFEQLNDSAQELKEAIADYFGKRGSRSEQREARS